MHTLVPWTPLELIDVFAHVEFTGGELRCQFELRDPVGRVLDSLREAPPPPDAWTRADGLWKTTCFELFFGEPGTPAYWELNISAHAALWNLYAFESYRAPQPPLPSEDWRLKTVSRTAKTLSLALTPNVPVARLEGCACAVLRAGAETCYFAERHAGPKPDFHARASFAPL